MEGYEPTTKRRRFANLQNLEPMDEDKCKFVASRWRILINTNHSYTADPAGATVAMNAMRDATMSLPQAIPQHNMLKFYEWQSHGVRGCLLPDSYYHLIEDYKIVFVFEKGPSNGNLHQHIDLQIDHNSCIHFKSTAFKEWIRARMVAGGIPEEIAEGAFICFKRVMADMTHKYFSKGLKKELEGGYTDATKEVISEFIRDRGDAPFSEGSGTEVIEIPHNPFSE